MPRKSGRLWRVIRIRYRRGLRRLEQHTPEWMRWLTPWGTSLTLHAVGLLILGLLYFAAERFPDHTGDIDAVFGDQLIDDLTALRDSDHAGDPFTTLMSNEPPSLSLDPAHPDPNVINSPQLPANFRLGVDLRIGISETSTSKDGRTKKRDEPDPGFQHGPESTAPFAGRRPAVRAKTVLKEGGTKESEAAVERGLDWLARHQRPDGGWSLDTSGQCLGNGCPLRPVSSISETGATGLALLPFLAAGQTHTEKGRYQETIRRGLGWLIKQQSADGAIETGVGGTAGGYSHAIASMALCEAYGITRDKSLRAHAQRSINYIVRIQNSTDGGWRYVRGQAGDTSVFGWMLFALRSANLAGLDIGSGTTRRCRRYLDVAAADPTRATYSYQPGMIATPTMTAEGLLGRQYLGWKRENPAMLQGVAIISAHLNESQERNIYYWYYATQLLHNIQGKEWERWNEKVRDTLVAFQVPGEVGCDRGSWDPELPDPDRWSQRGGRLYVTSLSLLTLEVYYRYLPLYRPAGAMAGDGDDAPAAAEIAAEPAPKTDSAAKARPKNKADRPGGPSR
jgi:hypothetical protein